MSVLDEPIHPGEVLKELYLNPFDLGAVAFARRVGVPRKRIERLIKGTTGRGGPTFSTSLQPY
jgi:plasmid maintenance system antidote protein VapI